MRVLLWSLMFTLLAACQDDRMPVDGGAADTAANAAPAPSVAPAEDVSPGVDFQPRKPVIEESIAYGEAAERNLNGVLTLPADSFEPPPGVLIIHEWWGLNETARVLARRLAGEGFVVLAIDLYGGEVADSIAQAQGLMTRVMTQPSAALDNIAQGIEYLRRYALAPRVATIGWSFGGTWSLQAGISLADSIDATVMYYGQIATDESEIRRLNSPLFGIFAGDDESISADSVVGFRAALLRAGKNAELRIYPGMRHEFATPGSDFYDAGQGEDAWQRTIEFLNLHLR